MLAAIPLLVIVVGAYNIFALTGSGETLVAPLLKFTMISGDSWLLTGLDVLLILGLVLLYLEIFKSTRTHTGSIIDHLLSMVLFVICLLEFVALKGFATAGFLLITIMTFIDVIAGFTVTISTARRDIGVGDRGF